MGKHDSYHLRHISLLNKIDYENYSIKEPRTRE